MANGNFVELAKLGVKEYVELILAYNKQESERPDVTPAKLLEHVRGLSETDATARKLVQAFDRANEALKAARKAVSEHGANAMGIETPNDEDLITKEAATEARKSAMGILKVAKDIPASAEWATSVQLPNVGRDGTSGLSDGTVKRPRVDLILRHPDGRELTAKNFTELGLNFKVKDGWVKGLADSASEAYAAGNEAPVSVDAGNGFTLYVSKKQEAAK